MLGRRGREADNWRTVVALRPGRRKLRPEVKELLVSRAGRRLQRLGLEDAAISIGRHSDCSVVLEGDVVSRQHVRLEPQDETFLLVDTSQNGTWLNGQRLTEPRLLVSGDRFRISDYELTYLEVSDDELTVIASDGAVVAGVRIDAAAREAWVEPGSRSLKLARQEFDLLALLVSNRSQVVTHAAIGDAIWGRSDVDGLMLSQYDVTLVQRLVSRLRKALHDAGLPEETLQNVRGVGYKLQ